MRFRLSESSSRLSARDGSRMHGALVLMADAFLYAEDLGCALWHFGVSIQELRSAGVSDNDLRWLIGKGHVEHSDEVTETDEEVRSFLPASGAVFSERACFILTERGQAFARDARRGGAPA